MNRRKFAPNMRAGFTLLELLVVIAIIGMLAAFVVPQVTGRQKGAQYKLEKSQVEAIKNALEMYMIDCGDYPSTQQGLKALTEKPAGEPSCKDWGPDPYMKKSVEADSWGNPYIYKYPGSENKTGFDLLSLGADGKPGGDGLNADIAGAD